MSDAKPLSEALAEESFVPAAMELRFIGGPNDGTTQQIPSWMLETHLSGHKYRLALSKSDDPSFPFKYVLVSHTLLKTP